MSSDGWMGNMHQVAGIYDASANQIRIYLDGKIVKEMDMETTDGIASSAYPVTIGKCPETGRGSEADFYEVRVYSKALSESELRSQNTASPAYGADSPAVQLWLDFDNVAEGALIGDLNLDGAVNAKDVKLLQDWLHMKKVTIKGDADLNGDGVWDVFDLSALKQIAK